MMAQESPAAKCPWWELPTLPYRPQYLQVHYLLAERQPSGGERLLEIRLITG